MDRDHMYWYINWYAEIFKATCNFITLALEFSSTMYAVRIKDNRLSFYFILFYFLLGFIVNYKTKKTNCDTVTGHMT